MKNKKIFFTFLPVLFFVAVASLPFVHAEIIEFPNPVKGKNGETLAGLIEFVYKQLLPIAFIAAAVVIVIAGFRYVLAVAGGKADLATKAKELLLPATEAAIIIVGGAAILHAVIETTKKIFGL